MKINNKNIFKANILLMVLGVVVFFSSCEREDGELSPISFPENPVVYQDGFSSGMEYYPYGDSKVDAFSVDTDDKYAGTSSMRFDVPDASVGYAGAIFRDDNGGRDFSSFNVLTFYAKASVSATLDNIGFGQDFGANEWEVSIANLSLTTNWQKYYIPIPDPSKLTQSQGLIWYATSAPSGFTFWLDEVQYENLGTVAHVAGILNNGADETINSFNGGQVNLSNVGVIASLPNGRDIQIGASPAYFEFFSSNQSVATIEGSTATLITEGESTITATLNGAPVDGSLTIKSGGAFNFAPTPAVNPANVISVFSDVYDNVRVDFFNGYWEPWQTTESADFELQGDNILSYVNFNFVGTSFGNPPVDADSMTHMHIDIFVPGPMDPSVRLQLTIRDFGTDQVDGGIDDSNQTITFNNSVLKEDDWASIEIPLTLANKSNVGLLIYENLGSPLTGFYVDNIYFYR